MGHGPHIFKSLSLNSRLISIVVMAKSEIVIISVITHDLKF